MEKFEEDEEHSLPSEYDSDQYVYCPNCDRLLHWTQMVGEKCTVCIEVENDKISN